MGTTFEWAVSGLLVDVFSFTPVSVAGTVSVSLVPLDASVSFFAALLNSNAFSFLPESSSSSTFSFQSAVDATVPLSLTVFGYAGDSLTLTGASGSYRGTISVQTVAAVPEPETYALLVAGLIAIGVMKKRSSRRRHP